MHFGFCHVPHLGAETTHEVQAEPAAVPLGLFSRKVSCTSIEQDGGLSEWTFVSDNGGGSSPSDCCKQNLTIAMEVIKEVFTELKSHCVEEQLHYRRGGLAVPSHKSNLWSTYTSKERLRFFQKELWHFLRNHAEVRTRVLSAAQLRFLILLQHLASEDTMDFYRPEGLRKHQDAFEGVLTDAVNAQLIRDAHRSEWSVNGKAYCLQEKFPQQPAEAELSGRDLQDERRHTIAAFQCEFVKALESYLLSFCHRRQLSALGTKRLIQAVTTQMSQCGLANLDRGSRSARYVVSNQGLDQRTIYNVSTMEEPTLGEVLKLSILCMKTGFSQYLDKQDDNGMQPKACDPTSYLYQYATLQFAPGERKQNCEVISCSVLDGLDEAQIHQVPEHDCCI